MVQRSARFGGLFCAIAVAAAVFVSVPANAGDPQQVSASPVMPAGCSDSVNAALGNIATYGKTMQTQDALNTVQQPKGYSSCIQSLIKDAQLLNNLFTNGFTWSALIKTFATGNNTSMLDSIEQQVCKSIDGLVHEVNNGLTVQTSLTNLLGMPGELAVTVKPAPTPPTTPPTPPAAPVPGTTSSASAMADDLDTVVNSGGASLTAQIPQPPGGVPLNDDDNDSPAQPPQIPTGLPASPMNATVCVMPDNRSDLSHSAETYDNGDAPPLASPTPMQKVALGGTGTADDLSSDQTSNNTQPAQAPNPIVPPATPAPAANTQPTQPAGNSNGVLACNPPTTVQIPSPSGTPCTANAKADCMAGSGCQPASQGAGGYYATDYQNNVFSHGPYGSGSNKGACAQLTESLVPGVGTTPIWRKGAQVMSNPPTSSTLRFGTAIATFFGSGSFPYQYHPGGDIYIQHTGIYLGQTSSCMFFLEEWKSPPGGIGMPHERCMKWGTPLTGTPTKADENHSVNYYVIVH